MNIPEALKYNSVISIPLFAIIALALIRKAKDYSVRNHTISKSIHFLNDPIQNAVFRLNFIIKAFLDFSFALYIIHHFQISLGSFISLMLLFSAFLFGTLAYFVEGKYTMPHKIATYTSGVLWVFGQFAVVRLIGDSGFTFFSIVFLFIPILLAFGYLFAKKTNVVVQAVCMSIWYIWILVLVFRYL